MYWMNFPFMFSLLFFYHFAINLSHVYIYIYICLSRYILVFKYYKMALCCMSVIPNFFHHGIHRTWKYYRTSWYKCSWLATRLWLLQVLFTPRTKGIGNSCNPLTEAHYLKSTVVCSLLLVLFPPGFLFLRFIPMIACGCNSFLFTVYNIPMWIYKHFHLILFSSPACFSFTLRVIPAHHEVWKTIGFYLTSS